MASPAYRSLARTCSIQLSTVFSELSAQTEDAYESAFLSELECECHRLLSLELAWYGRRRSQHFLEIQSPSALADACSLLEHQHFTGQLSVPAVQEMQALAADDVKEFKKRAESGKLRRDELSVNGGNSVRALRDVLNREFGRCGVLDAVSALTGQRTYVVGLALELSAPGASWWTSQIEGLARPPHTLYAHVDETISSPKAILYLTDVGPRQGATGFYPGAYQRLNLAPLQEIIGRVVGNVGNHEDSVLRSHYAKAYHQSMTSPNFRAHFMRLPPDLRFNSHMGWDVVPESLAERELVGVERKLLGPAGTFIAFDGAQLLHRGGMVEQGNRVALQIIFGQRSILAGIGSAVRRMTS
jgi:hypothetical protein